MSRKSIYEWAVEYCGDPASHVTRGTEIASIMIELGLRPEHKVLDLGCGALSQGVPLIRYLNERQYVGLDPNGWLIEAALEQNRGLEDKHPTWSYSSDFMSGNGPFDWVVAHSVLSHVAYWQMEQALSHVREVVSEGAHWLASLRIDQYDGFEKDWVYPGNSFFRLETVQSLAYYFGWHVEMRHDIRERIIGLCPNDIHDWIMLTAIPTSAELNNLRIETENRKREHDEIQKIAKVEYATREQAHLLALREEQAARDE